MSNRLCKFKLSCELLGHSMDVRAVCSGGGSNTIISGSRDKTVKVWQRNDMDGFDEIRTYKHHKNFVSCVYYMEFQNWICTGSNDSTICIYRNGSSDPFVVLRGHDSTVCCLSKGLGEKTIISGSWDNTARIWDIDDNGMFTFITLTGHEGAVWAVTCILSSEKYVTASADKNIIFWNANGEKIKVLKGHTDCIRGLINFDDGSLISCGNDATIKYWNNEGDCLRDFTGHTNFIYSISKNSALGSDVFVSGGEDSTIRLWSITDGVLADELTLPAQSVWAVACLNNGDIVTGCSDGVIRIFTKDSKRVAEDDKIKQFQLAVETRKLEKNATLGGYNKNNLPGPEILNQPGTKEGQTKMIRRPDGKILCYMWENNNWNMLGDVVGASGGTQSTSGKTLHEGKEYDYVFSVDISDTEPPKKLPYNNGDDPWLSAQNFIYKNNLPQVYLDQVANFIIKNANVQIIEQNSVTGFQDPFTGESRYIPNSNGNSFSTTGNVDPFTGCSINTSNGSNQNVHFTKGQLKHFPILNFLTFDTFDAGKVLDKLRDFNNKAENSKKKVNDQTLQIIIKLAEKEPEINSAAAEGLLSILCWPKDILFPVLDVTRLAIRDERFYSLLKPTTFIEIILTNLYTNLPNQLMTVRCLANLMNHELGRNTIDTYLDKIIDGIKILKEGSSNLQIAVATFYLNLSITQVKVHAVPQDKCEIVGKGVLEFLAWAVDSEACYRSMQTLGNLLYTPHNKVLTAQIISTEHVMDKIRKMANTIQESGWEKISECANALIATF